MSTFDVVPSGPTDAEIVRLYAERGLSFDGIAYRFGMDRERVREIVTVVGGNEAARARTHRRGKLLNDWQGHIEELVEAHGDRVRELVPAGATAEELEAELELPADELRDLLEACGVRARRTTSARIDDGAMLECLRAAVGERIRPLSAKDYQAWREAERPDAPAAVTIILRYGTWTAGLQAAGVPARELLAKPRSDRVPDEQVLGGVRRFLDDLDGERPTAARYNRWAQETGAPSLATVRNRLGTFNVAVSRALLLEEAEV